MGQDNSKAQAQARPVAVDEGEREPIPYRYTAYSVSKRQAAPPVERVIVVSPGNQARANEPELEALQGIPYFYPILRSSLNPNELEQFDDIDPRLLTNMCTRYEDYLRSNSLRVGREQQALEKGVRDTERAVAASASALSSRAQALARTTEKLKAVNVLSEQVQKADVAIQQIVPLLTQINSMLPDHLRLEPFVVPPLQRPRAQTRS
eukprot:m.37142 g.37142  ORF g.37142 m.37142 type:complete len:207 (+) comp11510_c0_seq1:87-707(+)